MTETTTTAMLIDGFLAARDARGLGPWEPIEEPDSYPDEDPAEYSDELNFFC